MIFLNKISRYILLSIFCAFAFNSAKAQKDTATYYLTASGEVAANKDVSVFYVKVSPSDSVSSQKLYKVSAFYNDGKRLFNASSLTAAPPLKLAGWYTTFFKNGNPMGVHYIKDGEMTGTSVLYYPNGKLYSKITTEVTLTDTTVSYEECRDPTGKILTTKGNGDWVFYDENLSIVTGEGHVKNYKPDSIWTFGLDGIPHTKLYKDGKEVVPKDDAGGKTFTAIDQFPEFPGGVKAFYDFLEKNIRYPTIARLNRTQGQIILSFIVKKDGSLSDIKVIRGIGDGCDDEAIRVMSLSPKWKPGIQHGKPVQVQYSVPVNFTLNGR